MKPNKNRVSSTLYSLKFTLYSLLSTLLAVSCQDTALVKPTATGRPYEVLVVMKEEMQKGPTGQALDSVLTSDIPGLPASEAFCSVSHSTVGGFTGALKMFRNIIFVDINPQIYTRVSLHFTRDENARDQYIITVHAPNQKEFIAFCEDNGDQITGLIDRGELKRNVAKLKKKYSVKTQELVKKHFDCNLYAAAEISCYKEGKDFIWTSTPGNKSNICVYSYPYTGPESFTKDFVLGMRDSVMRVNIPGSTPDDYMSTNHYMTECTPITVKGTYCMETRGLWEMSRAFLGGPFVSHSRVDTINNRVIVAEGFVMEFDKLNRTLMRNLEAALWTLETPGAEEVEEEDDERAESRE